MANKNTWTSEDQLFVDTYLKAIKHYAVEFKDEIISFETSDLKSAYSIALAYRDEKYPDEMFRLIEIKL